ncbi:MAG: single-stranded-DNA-specific exonuclease RecJ [Flavobacteriaceae bacterium]
MRWNIKETPQNKITSHLSKVLNVEPVIAKLLALRGIETYDEAKTFFRPNLANLHNPFLMKDMDVAVNRIEKAIKNSENIMVFGDYDVDGTTAVSLVYTFLKDHYKNVVYYIPDRYEEGYGVSYKGIDFASDNNISLIIALDCGTKAIDKIAYAKTKKVDFIICDHHRPGETLPNAIAVLNPKRDDCNYPYDELCGCGVGFKLIQALGEKQNLPIEHFVPYLDLVATAIAADIVPVTGENRTLAYFGMQVINQNPRIGIQALISQIKRPILNITDVVFTIAPRINAAGRMKSGKHAVDLLTEDSLDDAKQIAVKIEKYNLDRRDLDQKITKEALKQIEDNKEGKDATSVVFDESWHKGVIGIVASRLIEKHYRPTLVFTVSGDYYAASARSVKGFDVYKALEACSEFIEQFGGHKYAAGLTLKPENYKKFKAKFEDIVKNTLPPELKEPEIRVDSTLYLSDISPKFNRIIKQFGPFGPMNMKPVFVTSGLRDNGYGRKIGDDKTHLKLSVIEGSDSKTYNAIGFGLGEKLPLIKNGNDFEAVYTIEENHWKGNVSLQLNLKDLRS